jgi:hypothetical protein
LDGASDWLSGGRRWDADGRESVSSCISSVLPDEFRECAVNLTTFSCVFKVVIAQYYYDTLYRLESLTVLLNNQKEIKIYISLVCDKSVTTQNLVFLSYWYRKKRLRMHF